MLSVPVRIVQEVLAERREYLYGPNLNTDCRASVFVPPNTAVMSPDGTCGGLKAYTCQGYSAGNCCGPQGYCGNNLYYCDLKFGW
jgi:hypothetical protein